MARVLCCTRAVVAAVVPLLVELGRQLDHVGDLDAGVALVQQVQRLVVDVLVKVALLLPVVDDLVVAPHRPVMALELHVGLVAVEIDGLVEIARPLERIAHLRAAQREDVVQRVGGVLRHPHGAELREVGVHLGRGLGAGRHLEHHAHAVDGDFLAGPLDLAGRLDQAGRSGRCRLAKTGVDAALRIARQHARRTCRSRGGSWRCRR